MDWFYLFDTVRLSGINRVLNQELELCWDSHYQGLKFKQEYNLDFDKARELKSVYNSKAESDYNSQPYKYEGRVERRDMQTVLI